MKLPHPCPQCKAPIMNYGCVCAACGYRPEHPERVEEMKATVSISKPERGVVYAWEGEVDELRKLLASSERRADTARDDALEEAAKVIESQDTQSQIEINAAMDGEFEARKMAMGVKLISGKILSEKAQAIRAMKGQR